MPQRSSESVHWHLAKCLESRRPAGCLESLPILYSDLVRVHPGRPAAYPTATGWDEELQARTAGVRATRSESSLGYARSCSAGGNDRERGNWRT